MPTLTRRVTDEAGVLGGRAQALEQRLAAYEQRTGHQVAVLVIQSLEGEYLEGYSIKVAEQWRLGDKKRDDGLLVLVAMQDRAIRVEVGYGLEGVVTDAVASRVIRDIMIPRFQQGDPAGGIEAGVDALMRAAEGEALGPAPSSRASRDNVGSMVPVLLIAFFMFIGTPRVLRAFLFFCTGLVAGIVGFQSVPIGVGIGVAAAILGLILPSFRGRGGRGGGSGLGWWLLGNAMGGGGRRGGWSSGGGFSGGGGGFGGGGASGRW